MNRLNLVTAIASMLFLTLPRGQAQSGKVSLGISTGFASRYLYRGVERSTENWQAAIEGATRGWRGRIGAVRTFSSDASAEIQSALGYVWPIADQWTLEARGTHFWYVDAPVDGAPSHSFEGALELAWKPRVDWKAAVEFGYDIRYRSRAVEASLARHIELKTVNTILDVRAYAGNVAVTDVLPETTGAGLRDEFSYCGLGARMSHRLTSQWALQGEVSLASTAGQAREQSPLGAGSGSRGWFSIGTRFVF
jgi:hypothetical protein